VGAGVAVGAGVGVAATAAVGVAVGAGVAVVAIDGAGVGEAVPEVQAAARSTAAVAVIKKRRIIAVSLVKAHLDGLSWHNGEPNMRSCQSFAAPGIPVI